MISMTSALEGNLLLEMFPYRRNGRLIPHCPTEFLEIHRVHVDGLLLRRDDYILHILVDGDERSRLYVIISPVLHQELDRLPGTGELLDLIEYDQGKLFFVNLIQLKILRLTFFLFDNHRLHL